MIKRALIFVHRWLGIALCLLFLLWFPSGIGMLYFPMPSVTPTSRFERLPILQASTVMVSPGDAAAKLGVDARWRHLGDPIDLQHQPGDALADLVVKLADWAVADARVIGLMSSGSS